MSKPSLQSRVRHGEDKDRGRLITHSTSRRDNNDDGNCFDNSCTLRIVIILYRCFVFCCVCNFDVESDKDLLFEKGDCRIRKTVGYDENNGDLFP